MIMVEQQCTIADILIDSAIKYPDKVAVIFRSTCLTYKEIYKKVCQFSMLLKDSGVCEGDKLGIQLERSPDYVISYFAAAMIGAVIVPVNHELTLRESCSIVNYCDIKLLICTDSIKDIENISDKIVKKCNNLQSLMFINDNLASKDCKIICCTLSPVKNVFTKKSLNDYRDVIERTCVSPDSLALLLHTSGTMKQPKRVMLSHKNVISNAISHIKSVGIKHSDIGLVVLPMFFGFCNTTQLLSHILLGGTIVLMPGIFTPGKFYALVKKNKVTTLTCVPTILLYLLRYSKINNTDIATLRQVCFGGGFIRNKLLLELFNKFSDIEFIQTYGQTEASPRITALSYKNIKYKSRSVGKEIPGVSVDILSEKGKRCLPGRVGEIAVRSSGVMMGYYKRPEATKEVFFKDYLLTGDFGYKDKEGYLYLMGRKRNIIKRAGISIYPEEIEEYISSHPEVIEVVIIKEKHDFQGEIPVAKIILHQDSKMTEDGVLQFCKKGLAHYKIPAKIEFYKKLPHTYNLKIKRHAYS